VAKVSVIGTTSWGTTLAIILANNGSNVLLLARTQEEASALESTRENQRMLPGIPFPPGIHASASVEEAVSGAEMVVMVVPSKSIRENIRNLLPHLNPSSILLSATKGLEKDSAKRMSQVMEEELPEAFHSRISVLSGPNLAKEIAQGMPASTVVASRDKGIALSVQELFMSNIFRVYTNTDIVGVELGGALKNIMALGAGVSDGLGYGDNGKAAFITRGLAEITRLGVAAGANPITFAGLAGLGDLIATCSSPLSRNRYVGAQLASGRRLQDILSSMKNVAEGVDTTLGALHLASRLNVEMPLTQAISTILFQNMDPRQAVTELMGRAPRPEWSGIQP
jgi:glycerol-3-phosphate dehydrogenase (NAD(P)+)